MRNKLTAEISICQAETGFFFDELMKNWQIFITGSFHRYFEDKFAT